MLGGTNTYTKFPSCRVTYDSSNHYLLIYPIGIRGVKYITLAIDPFVGPGAFVQAAVQETRQTKLLEDMTVMKAPNVLNTAPTKAY